MWFMWWHALLSPWQLGLEWAGLIHWALRGLTRWSRRIVGWLSMRLVTTVCLSKFLRLDQKENSQPLFTPETRKNVCTSVRNTMCRTIICSCITVIAGILCRMHVITSPKDAGSRTPIATTCSLVSLVLNSFPTWCRLLYGVTLSRQ